MNAGMSAGTRAGTKVAWAAFALLVVAIAGYLVAWPVPIEPVAWQPAPSPGYTGVHSVNNRLADLQRIELGGACRPPCRVSRLQLRRRQLRPQRFELRLRSR